MGVAKPTHVRPYVPGHVEDGEPCAPMLEQLVTQGAGGDGDAAAVDASAA